MHIIHLDKLTLNYAGREIFRDVSWAIDDRARVGLVGPNGAGKSSLFKIMTGEVTPDSGYVQTTGEVRIAALPQVVEHPAGHTLIEAALIPPPVLAKLEAKLAKIEEKLGDPAVYGDPDRLTRALDEQQKLVGVYEAAGGLNHANRIEELLSLLGFSEADYDLAAETLSGGQKKLVALARLAVARPDVLLLDEPDNHLDLEAKRGLERFIAAYPGAVIIISHDRYLLDETVNIILELEAGKLTVYHGNYSAYALEREQAQLRQQQQYVTQQKEIARIQEAIKRFELWAARTEDPRHFRQARSRRKFLDKLEENGEIIEAVRESRKMDLQIEGWRGSNEVLKAEGLSLGFDDDLLLLDQSFLIWHGERVGLIGPNGAGKSVLMRAVLGQIEPLEGRIKIGPSVEIGHYAQEHQTLAEWRDRTPLEMIRHVWPRSEGDAVSFLLKFAFSYDQVRQPIRSMSGGEQSRLQLAMLMLRRPNLLLLDEPTNNLDIPSAEVLEAALEDFTGSALIISHDRYFLDRVVDRLLVLEDGALRAFDGNYTQYLEMEGKVRAG